MKKAAVLFPGIGYNVDRPLLYYSSKLSSSQGYDVIKVAYTGFGRKIVGNFEMMQSAFKTGREQAEKILDSVRWSDYRSLVFFSKSIGTVIALAYARDHFLDHMTSHVLFTPVQETFEYTLSRGIAFHGTADPWVDDEVVNEGCKKLGISLLVYPDANHSLESGDVLHDIHNMEDIMKKVKEYLVTIE